MTIAALVLWVVAIWLLQDAGWRVAVGVLLFVWANNLVYTGRLQDLGVVPKAAK